MTFTCLERTLIQECINKVDNGKSLNWDEQRLVMSFLNQALQLSGKVQSLQTYLALPKFQGTETDSHQCKHCYQWTDEEARKDWVSVQDVLNRLD